MVYPPTRVTTFVMTESETHRRPRHVGEFQLKIEDQNPAHCVKYMYSAMYLTTCDPTRRATSLTDAFIFKDVKRLYFKCMKKSSLGLLFL